MTTNTLTPTKLPRRMVRMDLSGLNFGIFGVHDKSSLSYSIGFLLGEYGANVAYVTRREETAESLREADFGYVLSCDVTNPEEVDACFERLATRYGRLDGILHSIAGGVHPRFLRGRFIDSPTQNLLNAVHVSAASFRELATRAAKLMPNGGGMLALSFLAAERWFPHYNDMAVAKAALEAVTRGLAYDLGEQDIWVNAIRTSPKQTHSARAIGNSELIGEWARGVSVREGRATRGQIAQIAAFLLATDCGITGEVINVDNGASNVGMYHPRHASFIEASGEHVAAIGRREKVRFSDGEWDWDE